VGAWRGDIGVSDQRPSLPGGPWRRDRNVRPPRRVARDEEPARSERSGAGVSLGAPPDHPSAQSALTMSPAKAPASAALAEKKSAPRVSRSLRISEASLPSAWPDGGASSG